MDRYKTRKIGFVDQGDGSDEYLLVTDPEDDIDLNKVEDFFFGIYYRDTHAPGGYFCHQVTVSKLPRDNECIVIVHHRYDI